MSKCLVLGANGFIGSHVVDTLVAAGHSVRAFDRFSGGKLNFLAADRVTTCVGDLLNKYDLARALDGVDYVFHFISTTTPITAENDPTIDIVTNIRMSVELFQLCVDAGITRVIYLSTGGAIYGLSPDASNDRRTENDLTLPVSPYAIGKLAVENYLRYFGAKFGLDSVVFRVSNPYGNRQSVTSRQGVIPIFLESVHNNQPITVYGDGTMVRDYIYVQDLAELVVTAFDRGHMHHIYNVGSGVGASVAEVVACVEKVTGVRADVHKVQAPATFVDRIVLDTTRFTDEFGIAAETSLLSGIEATYRAMIFPTGGEPHHD